MKTLNEILDNNSHQISNIIKKGKCLIANVDGEYIAIKEKNNHNIKETYDYLSSRNFDYYPKIKWFNEKYNIYEYVEDVNVPLEQKAFDMMTLLSLLHNKTTFYKEIDSYEYKELYEEIVNKINYTYNFYNSLISNIETHIYMSPCEYLIARNISKIIGALEYSKRTIDQWYDIVKNSAKKRVVLLYNNVDINHVIRNKDLYLLNFEKSKMDMPVYDIYNFYMKYAFNFDIYNLLEYYEEKYPFLEEEKLLFYVLISIPQVIELNEDEIVKCKNAKNIIDILYKSETLISKNTKEGNSE